MRKVPAIAVVNFVHTSGSSQSYKFAHQIDSELNKEVNVVTHFENTKF